MPEENTGSQQVTALKEKDDTFSRDIHSTFWLTSLHSTAESIVSLITLLFVSATIMSCQIHHVHMTM